MILLSFIVLLFLFIGAGPILGQPVDLDLASRAAQEQAAMSWSQATGFPQRLVQTDGSVLEVMAIYHQQPFVWTTHNQAAATLTRTSPLHTGLSGLQILSGADFAVGLWDAGPVYSNHNEFQDRIRRMDQGGIPSNHATHVAGTLAARGILPEARGMAYAARIHAYNWNLHGNEMQQEAQNGLLVSNHSYGRIAGWHYLSLTADSTHWYWFGDPRVSRFEDYIFGFYDRDAALFDELGHLYPHFLPVVAAGNDRDDIGPLQGRFKAIDQDGSWQTYTVSDRRIPADGTPDGYDTLTSIGVAKNVLTVGAVGKNLLRTTPLSAFSSMGPTDDGRIKPELVGVGEDLYSATATHTAAYESYSGTSMAAPNIAGSLLLLQELAVSQWEAPLRASSLKGLVLHTATDLGPSGPDYQYGWGLLDTEAAALHLTDSFRNPIRLKEDTLYTGKVYTIPLVLTRQRDVKITLAWTDPPGRVKLARDASLLNDRTPKLVHDLDMALYYTEGDQTYDPYILFPDSPQLAASTGKNRVDPVEQIYIRDALPGKYHITISNQNWQEDYQVFSLIVDGLEDPGIPVELKELAAEATYGKVTLQWATTVERTEGAYIILKALNQPSALAAPQEQEFAQVGTHTASGYQQAERRYQFQDQNHRAGLNRYRLLFEESGTGKRILLKDIEVMVPAPDGSAVISTYPNPFTNQFNVILDLSQNQEAFFDVQNALGKRVYTSDGLSLLAGRQTLSVSSDSWPAGVYFLRVYTEDGNLTRKLIKR